MNIEKLSSSAPLSLPQQSAQIMPSHPKTKVHLDKLTSLGSLSIHHKNLSSFFTCIKQFFQILCLPFYRLYDLLFPKSAPKESEQPLIVPASLQQNTPETLNPAAKDAPPQEPAPIPMPEQIIPETPAPILQARMLENLNSTDTALADALPKQIAPETPVIDIAKESLLLCMQDAYEIARYIHTFHTDYREEDGSDKPITDITGNGHFKNGPNWCYSQLQKGLVLVGDSSGEITDIDTPLGRWHILSPLLRISKDDGEEGRIAKIFKEIEKSLKLVKMPRSEVKKGSHHYLGPDYQFYVVTQWNGKQIPAPEYLKQEDFISREDAKKIWNEFANTHADLA